LADNANIYYAEEQQHKLGIATPPLIHSS